MAKSKSKPSRREQRRQYAALPYRRGRDGVEVMLVTSRGTGRWIIPKGWPMKRKAGHEVAAQEAFEEAGVEGIIEPDRLGQYRYAKVLSSGAQQPCAVDVHLLQVITERDEWPERAERQRAWVSPTQAAKRVDEPELKALMEAFAALVETDR